MHRLFAGMALLILFSLALVASGIHLGYAKQPRVRRWPVDVLLALGGVAYLRFDTLVDAYRLSYWTLLALAALVVLGVLWWQFGRSRAVVIGSLTEPEIEDRLRRASIRGTLSLNGIHSEGASTPVWVNLGDKKLALHWSAEDELHAARVIAALTADAKEPEDKSWAGTLVNLGLGILGIGGFIWLLAYIIRVT